MPPMLLLDETEINEMSLLEGYSNLPFCEEPNGPYYILADDDEPDVPLHALVEQPGLVVWDFSDVELDNNVAGDLNGDVVLHMSVFYIPSLVYINLNSVRSPLEALRLFRILYHQNTYESEHGCLTFHTFD